MATGLTKRPRGHRHLQSICMAPGSRCLLPFISAAFCGRTRAALQDGLEDDGHLVHGIAKGRPTHQHPHVQLPECRSSTAAISPSAQANVGILPWKGKSAGSIPQDSGFTRPRCTQGSFVRLGDSTAHRLPSTPGCRKGAKEQVNAASSPGKAGKQWQMLCPPTPQAAEITRDTILVGSHAVIPTVGTSFQYPVCSFSQAAFIKGRMQGFSNSSYAVHGTSYSILQVSERMAAMYLLHCSELQVLLLCHRTFRLGYRDREVQLVLSWAA